MAPDARQLIEEIRGGLQGLSERIRSHPYVTALAEGKVEREKLRLFAGEQYNIIKYDMRSFAVLLSRQSDFELRKFFADSVSYEAAAFEAIFPFAEALGLSVADLDAYEPLPGAHMYPAFLALTAMYGSAAEMAGAFIIDMEGWGGNCGAMSRILKESYGFTGEQVRFFDHFAAEDPTFEARSLTVIQKGLDGGVEPAFIRRTARLMLSYELLYWDTVYEASVG
jgi:pyrroloquinoline quinone (PQQ) biosynthesis protein C